MARQPSDSLRLPLVEVAQILSRPQAADSGTVAHWFRYPAQGHAAWLRQAKHGGQVWEADQLAILPSVTVDRDTFIAEVVKSKLAFLGGSIDGQAVTVEARNCARFDLLLGPEVVEWSEPVTVFCNGQRRHHGLVEPSIRTLLEEAYATWDFQRLVVARLSFSINADAS
ncbi:MAG: hypothetical protein KJ749_15230 [Planctomycetes bacterium]|nr:hypothetical protein [Planctomycetota bacterium]